MSAQDKPVSRPMNQKFNDNYDRIFKNKVPDHERNRVKDWVYLGLSPSTEVIEIDCTGKKS